MDVFPIHFISYRINVFGGGAFFSLIASVATDSVQAHHLIHNHPDANHEYLPIAGLSGYTSASQRLILGSHSPAIKENRVGLLLLLCPFL